MKCLRSLVEVSRLDRVKNKEVHMKAGIEMELASREGHRLLRRSCGKNGWVPYGQ